MRITKHINIAVNFTKHRISMLGKDGEAWDHILYIGRAMEHGRHQMRAWQIHVLWFNLSVWNTNCKPLQHALHVYDTARRE